MCTILLGRKSSYAFIQHISEKLPYTRNCPRFWNRFLLWTFRTERTIPGLENHRRHPAKLLEVGGETLQISLFLALSSFTGLVNGLMNDLPFSLSLVPTLEQSAPTRSRTLQTGKEPPQRCHEPPLSGVLLYGPLLLALTEVCLELLGYR